MNKRVDIDKYCLKGSRPLDNDGPALGALGVTVLDIHDGVVEALGELAGLGGLVGGIEGDVDIVTLVVDLLDGADNARSAGT